MLYAYVFTDSEAVCGRTAAVLCYKWRRSEVSGTRTDTGARHGLHQAESSDQSVLNAEPGRP